MENSINSLPDLEKKLFDRFFRVDTTVGHLTAPESMQGWIVKNFGSLEKVQNQRIVKVTNRLTLEGALFNELRASRPMECKVNEELWNVIENSKGDPFCKPLDGTPSDLFGRVEGSSCVTASNIAKYDGFHGVVIFHEHDPLVFNAQTITDYFETGLEWASRAYGEDPSNKYYFFMWNCLWKSGASIIHGHAQMTLTKGMHYPKVEHWRRVAMEYRQKFGSDFFEDLYQVHRNLELAWEYEDGVKGIAYLTPLKEKEIILWSHKPGVPLYHAVHSVLEKYRKTCTFSFNLVLYLPPIAPADENWEDFPAVVRIVDRGDPNNKTADFGAMELYAASVVSSDPFRVADLMKG